MNETTIPTISSEAPEQPGMNYRQLRKEGLAHLQRLAGKIWTDYNSHDPGVTILEQLCYTLTDLAYRTNYDMPDLLATTEGDPYRSLYSPAQVLTTRPITVTDLRKVLVDIEGVQNAWIEALDFPDDYFYYDAHKRLLTFEQLEDHALPTKGFYRVYIQRDKEADIKDDILLPQLEKCVQSNRKLAEDFREISLLDTQPVHLKATIEIGPVEDADLLMARIYRKTADYISPYVRFHTLDEMLDSGKRIDEVMEGPILQHGFIHTEEIEKLDKRIDLRISDIVHEIMKLEGVEVIKDVSICNEAELDEETQSKGKYYDWVLNLDPGMAPEFNAEEAEITLVRDDLEVIVDKERAIALYIEMKESTLYPVLEEKDRNLILPEGEDRDIESYPPFQNDFPAPYGIGEAGLASSEPQRQGQAKQLKAYLLFFEQLLANYFSQISHFKDLMDFHNPEIKTYFAQALSGLPGLEELLQDPDNYEQWLKNISEDTDDLRALDRKNRFLDHLLARFCEEFTDYSLVIYGSVVSDWYRAPQQQVYDKQTLLKEYPENSAERGQAFDYTRPVLDTDNVSGLEKRLANLLGIQNHHRRSLLDDREDVRGDINKFYKGIKDRHYYPLFELGLSPQNYRLNEHTRRIEIGKDLAGTEAPLLQFTDPAVLAETIDDTHNLLTYKKAVEGLIAQWQEWNSALEGFYMMEHTLLCPQSAEQGGAFLSYAFHITATQRSKIGYGVTCISPDHNLIHGEEIQIYNSVNKNGKGAYDGIYQVYNVQKDSFEIDHPDIMAPTHQARWMRTSLFSEPYSLQLSFVFPDWPARFRNTSFRDFITQTVRRETPAHIQVYVHWFSSFNDIPDEKWHKDEIKAYMKRMSIPYSSADSRQDLLGKIPRQVVMEQWEEDYFHWLQEKTLLTGQPDTTWALQNVNTYMQRYGISSQPDDTPEEKLRKTDQFIQNTRKWALLYQNGEPDQSWPEKDPKALMDIFSIPYETEDTRQALLRTITHFRNHYKQWQLLSQTETIDESWTMDNLKAWMDIFNLPHSEQDLERDLLQNIAEFHQKAQQWLEQDEFPSDSWTDKQLKQHMDIFHIPYRVKDTRYDLQRKIMQYDRDVRNRDRWCFGRPDDTWTMKALEHFMAGFGIPYTSTDTKEVRLEQIEQVENSYRKWALLKDEPGRWTFPANNRKWTKSELQEFAGEFSIPFRENHTKTKLAGGIEQYAQQAGRYLDPDANTLQYYADRLIEHLRMGNTTLPYAFDQAGTIQFSSDQWINLTDFDLVDSGNRSALDVTPEQTIEMWIKPVDAQQGIQRFFIRTTQDNTVVESLLIDAQGILNYVYNEQYVPMNDIENPIPTDVWTHIAVIRNQNKVTGLINGEVTISEEPITVETPPGALKYIRLGRDWLGDSYTGKIAEVRLWDTTRASREISENMYLPLLGTEPGLQGYWKLDENLGNTSLDSTPNANHGIMQQFLSQEEVTMDDIIVDPRTIEYKGTSHIRVPESQRGVWYQLRIDEGTDSWQTNAHWGEPKEGNGTLLSFKVKGLETTQTFNILAVKPTDHQLDGKGEERVESDPAEIRVKPKVDLVVTPTEFTLNGDGSVNRQVTVNIYGSQYDVTYRLYYCLESGLADLGNPAGDPGEGDPAETLILTSEPIEQDCELCIVATYKE